jgi:hypothetical protein
MSDLTQQLAVEQLRAEVMALQSKLRESVELLQAALVLEVLPPDWFEQAAKIGVHLHCTACGGTVEKREVKP